LYESKEEDSEVKIIDFGFARKFGDFMMKSTVGTASYVAPQVIL
jgi:serine/threonine protein kinase